MSHGLDDPVRAIGIVMQILDAGVAAEDEHGLLAPFSTRRTARSIISKVIVRPLKTHAPEQLASLQSLGASEKESSHGGSSAVIQQVMGGAHVPGLIA